MKLNNNYENKIDYFDKHGYKNEINQIPLAWVSPLISAPEITCKTSIFKASIVIFFTFTCWFFFYSIFFSIVVYKKIPTTFLTHDTPLAKYRSGSKWYKENVCMSFFAV